MNERLKAVRKALNLTQEEFGKKLGVSRGVIVNMELNRSEMKPLFVEHICEVFSINEEWLRTGKGEMFEQNDDIAVDQLIRKFSLSTFGQAIVKGYMSLSETDKIAVGNYIKSVAREYESAENVGSLSEADNQDIDREVEDYRKELEREKSTMSSASDGTDDSIV